MEDGRPKGARRGWDPGPPQHSWFFLVLIALIWAVHRPQHPLPSTSLSASLSHNGFWPGAVTVSPPLSASLSHIDISSRGQNLIDASAASFSSVSSRFYAQPYTSLLGGGGNIHQHAISGSDSAFCTTEGFVSGRLPTLWGGDGFAIVIGFALPRRQLRLLSRKAPRLLTERLSPHVAGQSSG